MVYKKETRLGATVTRQTVVVGRASSYFTAERLHIVYDRGRGDNRQVPGSSSTTTPRASCSLSTRRGGMGMSATLRFSSYWCAWRANQHIPLEAQHSFLGRSFFIVFLMFCFFWLLCFFVLPACFLSCPLDCDSWTLKKVATACIT